MTTLPRPFSRIALGLLVSLLAPLAQATCTLAMNTPTVAFTTWNQSVYAQAIVKCDSGLPYTVETNAPNGQVALTQGASSLPVQVLQAANGLPMGPQAMGQGVGGTGTGNEQAVSIEMRLHSDQIPAVGVYQGTVDVSLSF